MSHGRHKATERSSRHRACKPRPIASGLSARFRRLRFEGLEDRRLLTTTFTTPITIGAGNYSYDGQDIIVNDTTVTINGAHSFNSLQLVDDAVLTDSALASLNLTISNTLIVDSTSAISADGRGNGAAGGLGAGGNAGSPGVADMAGRAATDGITVVQAWVVGRMGPLWHRPIWAAGAATLITGGAVVPAVALSV